MSSFYFGKWFVYGGEEKSVSISMWRLLNRLWRSMASRCRNLLNTSTACVCVAPRLDSTDMYVRKIECHKRRKGRKKGNLIFSPLRKRRSFAPFSAFQKKLFSLWGFFFRGKGFECRAQVSVSISKYKDIVIDDLFSNHLSATPRTRFCVYNWLKWPNTLPKKNVPFLIEPRHFGIEARNKKAIHQLFLLHSMGTQHNTTWADT